jgi:ankyrin repeat protein
VCARAGVHVRACVRACVVCESFLSHLCMAMIASRMTRFSAADRATGYRDSASELERIAAAAREAVAGFSGNFPPMAVALRIKVLAGLKRLCTRDQDTFERVWSLIHQGSDVNARVRSQRTPLHMAAKKGLLDAVRELVRTGADVSAVDGEGRSALDLADDEDCREELKRLGANGWTPLMMAAEAGDAAATQRLLDADADVRAANWQLRTALHMAAERGDHRIVQALVRAKASLRAVDVDGRAAVELAAASESAFGAQCVEILVGAGAVSMQRPPPKRGDKVCLNAPIARVDISYGSRIGS